VKECLERMMKKGKGSHRKSEVRYMLDLITCFAMGPTHSIKLA